MSFDSPPVAVLEETFRAIHEKEMADMPVLNTALCVEALGFQLTAYGWLGILITPWFMNLVLLPAPDRAWTSLASGKQFNLTLPSGEYLFTADQHLGIGEFFSCQLFSPMYHFADQEIARIAAQAALAAVLANPEVVPEAPVEEVSPTRRRLLGTLFRKN